MALNFLLKRTATANKRPTAAQLDVGELAMNYASDDPGIFLEDNSGAVRKIGPATVGSSAPNSSAAGQSGNSTGEMWLDTSQTPDELKVWNGTTWISVNAVVSGTASLLEGPVVFEAQASSNLSFGDVVYISGASGDTPIVEKARANSSTTMPAFGFASADITSGNTGNIITFGSIEGDGSTPLDTSGLTVNDVVYVSADTAGAWTTTKPTGESNLIQNIGRVQRVNSQNGVIKVGGAGRASATPNLNDGNIFIGDSNNEATTTSLSTAISSTLGLTRTAGTGSVIQIDTAAVNLQKDLAFANPGDIAFPDNTSEALQLTDSIGTPYITFDSTDDAECINFNKKLCLDAGTQVDMSGSTIITLLDNDFDALDIKEGNNLYMRFNTTNSGEKLQILKNIYLAAELHMADYLLMDNANQIRFRELNSQGTNYVALQGAPSLSATTVFTLPESDGSANLGWANALIPAASIDPTNNGDLVVEATSNTTITFKLKGSDGTVRTGTVTLS